MEIASPSRGSRFPSARLGLFITGLIVLALGLLGLRSVDWFLLKKSLRSKFTNIEWISTSELADWLANKGRPAPVLLDVRTPAEWNVSHLPGARRVDPSASAESAAGGLPKQTPIVTYCAVGYRSGEIATRLRAAGFSDVHNLEGSIFQWANEHRPLVRERLRGSTGILPVGQTGVSPVSSSGSTGETPIGPTGKMPVLQESPGQEAVSQVHPYNPFWGRLLNDDVRAPAGK